jgi:branched-subunit amino acid aminotransferase/4-amino-4-deoxychorismate lyase
MDADFQIFTTVRYDPQLTKVPGIGKLQHAGWNSKTTSPLYMFDLHRDRLLKAAKYWEWQPAVDLLSRRDTLDNITQLVLDHIGSQAAGPVRVKILISSQGRVTIESGATKPKSLENLFPVRLPSPTDTATEQDPRQTPAFSLLVDTLSIGTSPFTNFKTTKRPMYDAARQRAGIGLTDFKEVLVINEDTGDVMEGTIFTPYFWRNGRWVTPPVSAQFSPGVGSGGQDGTTRRWALEQ